jgi:DNA-directed RNA polymerase subunit RPC12/RpoP
MPSSIRLRCPGCGARIKAPFELFGQERGCPRCGKRLLVKAQPPEDSGVLIVSDRSGDSSPRRLTELVG